jgi:hypothetical protein
VVLGPRRQREGEAQGARGLRRGGDPLDGVRPLVETSLGVVVLDRAADGPCGGDPRDCERSALRIGAVAVLQVD